MVVSVHLQVMRGWRFALSPPNAALAVEGSKTGKADCTIRMGVKMSEHDDRVKYADCMTFIRYRLEVIDRFLSRQLTTGYEIPDMETICLQFRKVFELIAMSSLCANRDKCSEVKQ